jgi:hypothetical protein
MAAEGICDECGTRMPMLRGDFGEWFKPRGWSEWNAAGQRVLACSQSCFEKLIQRVEESDQ